MAKLRVMLNEFARQGTWSAAGPVEGFPASNLGHPHLSRVAKTGGTTTAQWFKSRLPDGAQPVQAFALVAHDFDGTETDLFLEGNTTDDFSAPAFSQEVTARAGLLVEFFDEAQAYEYWRLRFTTANAGDVRQAGRMLLFSFYECARNPKRESVAWGLEDDTVSRRTPGGQSYHDVAAVLKTFAADFDAAPFTQTTAFRELSRRYGRHTPFLMSFNHDTHPLEWALYGRLTKLGGYENAQGVDADFSWNLSLAMIEEL